VENIFDIYLKRDEYDMRELSPDPFPSVFYVDYLNTPKVQAAIGAYQNFSESSGAVSSAFTGTGDDGREFGTIGVCSLRHVPALGSTWRLTAIFANMC